jgi:hypothetical protein
MQIPFTIWDISLVLAVTTIVLMITAELASTYYGHTNLVINMKKLKKAYYATGTLFLVTVAIRIFTIVAFP